MAEDNLKQFTVNWVITGLLVTCLLAFTIVFMYNNNPIGLGDDANSIINTSSNNYQSNLYEVPNDIDETLNITAATNPERSELGSRYSVATSYKLKSTGKGMFATIKPLIAWIFSGDIGKILLSVFGGLVGALSIYYITKWIRTGT